MHYEACVKWESGPSKNRSRRRSKKIFFEVLQFSYLIWTPRFETQSTTNQLRGPRKFTKHFFASVSSHVKWDSDSEGHRINTYNTHRIVPDTQKVSCPEDDDSM